MLLTSVAFHRLCQARDLLRESCDEPRSIEQIAQIVGISPFHFIRQFEALFGRTPHQYRIDARLARARQLLAGGRHSVTDICFDVGCSSLGSFSALFARRVGLPPSAYRARARTMIQVPGLPPPDLTPGCLCLMSRLPPSAIRSFREAPRMRS